MIERAMIMAAGVGTRLEPLTLTVCKPMVPLANQPAIVRILNLLKQHGVQHVTANLHYKGDQIEAALGDGSAFGMSARYSKEPELMGTAGGVKKVADHFPGTFVVVSGDALTDCDLTDLVRFHQANGAIATIALKEEDDTSKFGVVITDKQNRIRSFQEKPKPEEAKSHWVNTGIYVFEPQIFDLIPEGFYDFGSQLFPLLAEQNAPFFGYKMDGYWCDVGSLTQYRQAHYDLLEGKVQSPVDHRGQSLTIDPTAVIDPEAVLGDRCRVGPGARVLGRTTLGAGVTVESGASVTDSVIWDGARLASGAAIEEAIIGRNCQIGSGARIESGAVLGDGVQVGARARIQACRLWPGTALADAAEQLADLKP